MVVTGDITQVDLPREQRSGLIVVGDVLDAVEGIEFVRFGGEDVVRHKLVQRIVEAYDAHSQREVDARPPASSARAARRRRSASSGRADPQRLRVRRCSRSSSSAASGSRERTPQPSTEVIDACCDGVDRRLPRSGVDEPATSPSRSWTPRDDRRS